MKYKYWDLTRRVIGCAINVHNAIGPGFKESVYKKAMTIEMTTCGINSKEEVFYKVFYMNIRVGARRADCLVENVLLLEYKARSALDNSDLCQGKNNLEASGFEIGLLFNFGGPKLQFRRLYNNRGLKDGNDNSVSSRTKNP